MTDKIQQEIKKAKNEITKVITQYILDWESGIPNAKEHQAEIEQILTDFAERIRGSGIQGFILD